MTGFLLDTNVVSELRKGQRTDGGVADWFAEHASAELWVSVLVVGELRRGVELIARRDRSAAEAIGLWLDSVVVDYADRILPITARIAQRWAVITVPVPVVDGLLAATALEHELILVTRNLEDVGGTGVRCVNPFPGS